MTTVVQNVPAAMVWFNRLRFVLATALVWGALHYIVGALALPRGLDRPAVLAGAGHGPLTGVLVMGVLWLGAAVSTLLTGARSVRGPLMILGLALALWAFEGGPRGGTMDNWLTLRNEKPGPPVGGPYWILLLDYAYLLAGIAGAAFVTGRLMGRGGPASASGSTTDPVSVVRTTLPRTAQSQVSAVFSRAGGIAALALIVIIAGMIAWVLMGPAVGDTWRGQVYFAMGVGLFAGAYAARRLIGVAAPVWYWLAPFALGTFGLIVAGIRPALSLPPAYQHLNTIPAWALARALPVEMIGVGLVATMWAFRPREHADAGPAS